MLDICKDKSFKIFIKFKSRIFQVPAVDIAINMVFPFFQCPVITWAPVVELDHGQQRFLTDEPNRLFEEGKFARVNVMAGITADEFMLPVAGELIKIRNCPVC